MDSCMLFRQPLNIASHTFTCSFSVTDTPTVSLDMCPNQGMCLLSDGVCFDACRNKVWWDGRGRLPCHRARRVSSRARLYGKRCRGGSYDSMRLQALFMIFVCSKPSPTSRF